MEIITNYKDERVVKSYDIIGLSSADMYEMSKLFDIVMNIRINHLTSDKKEYLSDEDLMRIEAVLDTLTEGHRVELKESVFKKKVEAIQRSNEALRRMKLAAGKPAVDNPNVEGWADEAVAAQTSTMVENY